MSKEMMTDAIEEELFDLVMKSESKRVLATLLGKLSVNGSISVEDFKDTLIKFQVKE